MTFCIFRSCITLAEDDLGGGYFFRGWLRVSAAAGPGGLVNGVCCVPAAESASLAVRAGFAVLVALEHGRKTHILAGG